MATQIRENSRRVDLSVNGSTISIDVSEVYSVCTHIISHFIIGTAYHREEITVMVGRDQCVVQSFAKQVITCTAPQRDEPVMESVTVSGHTPHCTHCIAITTTFQVSFGQNINNSVGQLEYFSQAAAVDIAPIAGELLEEQCC